MAEYKGKLLKGLFTRATKCLMSDDVTSVEDAITKNDFGTRTSITVNQMYTFPSDGYVLVETTSTAGDYSALLLYGSTNANIVSAVILRTPTTNMSQATPVMVRKGMRCLLQNGNASFITLT